jgi:GNAT superfamily N-acetyltransferase
MEVRLATRDDIPDLQRIRGAVRENRLVSVALTETDYVRHLDRDARTWVATWERRVAGFAAGDRALANVWALFIDPAYERRGAGRALHDACVDWLLEAVPAIWLTTEPGTRAERFYRAAGWRAAGTTSSGELRFELSRPRPT